MSISYLELPWDEILSTQIGLQTGVRSYEGGKLDNPAKLIFAILMQLLEEGNELTKIFKDPHFDRTCRRAAKGYLALPTRGINGIFATYDASDYLSTYVTASLRRRSKVTPLPEDDVNKFGRLAKELIRMDPTGFLFLNGIHKYFVMPVEENPSSQSLPFIYGSNKALERYKTLYDIYKKTLEV